jgi:hypothetical protein
MRSLILFFVIQIFSSNKIFAKEKYVGAAGVAVNAISRADYGSSNSQLFFPEIFGYGYIPAGKKTFLRAGARFGYLFDNPQMPKSIQITEKDYSIVGECGFLYDWVFVPSLTFGGGVILRSIQLETASPVVVAEDKVSRKENLPFAMARIGLGLPILAGLLSVEPYFGSRYIFDDTRESFLLGAEISVGF